MAIGSITYDDTTRKEDLVDVLINISPDTTPLLSTWKQTTCSNTLHEYLTDTLAAAAANAQPEGQAFSVSDPTSPTRINNNTQIFTDWVTVSRTQMAVDHAGQADPMKYQITKQLKEHAKDIEAALMAGSRASGSSGVARSLVGAINAISTNASTRSSGASLGESDFNDIFALIYASTDDVATNVYVGATLKRDISAFTAGNTKNVDASDKRLVRPVSVYETDFGIAQIMLHRNVSNAANAKALVALRPDLHATAWLRRTKAERLTPDGDRERAMINSELTAEHRGQAAEAYFYGFTS
jgi:hypothetical protein